MQAYNKNNYGFKPEVQFKPVDLLAAFRDAHPTRARASYGLPKQEVEAIRATRQFKREDRIRQNRYSALKNPAWDFIVRS